MMNPCFFCGGAAHPATGCQYSETCLACWRCTRLAWRWVKGWTNVTKSLKQADGTKTQVSFYGAVERSQQLLATPRSSPSGGGRG